jgi:hypothetical protein
MGSDQSKYAGSGEKSAEVQEVRLDYYALLDIDEEATEVEIKASLIHVLPDAVGLSNRTCWFCFLNRALAWNRKLSGKQLYVVLPLSA